MVCYNWKISQLTTNTTWCQNGYYEPYTTCNVLFQEYWGVAQVETSLRSVSLSFWIIDRIRGATSPKDVLGTTRITPEAKQKYTKVIDVFDSYFKVRKNLIFEWACFNKRNQLQGCTSWNSRAVHNRSIQTGRKFWVWIHERRIDLGLPRRWNLW